MGTCLLKQKALEHQKYESAKSQEFETKERNITYDFVKSDHDQLYVIGYNANGEFGLNNQRNYTSLTRNNQCNRHSEKKIYKQKCITHINSAKDFAIYSDTINQLFWLCGSADGDLKTFKSIHTFRRKDILIDKICSTVHSNCIFWISDKKAYYKNEVIDQLNDVIDIHSTRDTLYALCGCDTIEIIINHWYKNDSDNIMFQMPIDIINLIMIMFRGGRNEIFIGTHNYGRIQIGHGWNELTKLTRKNVSQIACQKDVALFLDCRGIVWSQYENQAQPTSMRHFMEKDIKIRDIKCGENYSIAIDYDENIYAWGDNSAGQLGDGTTTNVHIPQLIEALKDVSVIEIACGRRHSYAKTKDGRHFLWGSNYFNECILESHTERIVKVPHCIDDVVRKVTNGKRIKSVFVGGSNTQIIVTNT